MAKMIPICIPLTPIKLNDFTLLVEPIKIGDTFKAGNSVWEVVEMPFDNWVYLTNHQHFTIEVIGHNQYMARKTSYGKGQYYLDELEMRMCIEIIDKLKGEVK